MSKVQPHSHWNDALLEILRANTLRTVLLWVYYMRKVDFETSQNYASYPRPTSFVPLAVETTTNVARLIEIEGTIGIVRLLERLEEMGLIQREGRHSFSATEAGSRLAYVVAEWIAQVEQQDITRLVSLLEIEADNVVLDIGGGAGHTLLLCIPWGALVNINVDLDAQMLRFVTPLKDLAAEFGFKHDRIVPVQADALHLPIRSASVDRVISKGVCLLLNEPYFLAEVSRVLRPGGRALIIGPGWRYFFEASFHAAVRMTFPKGYLLGLLNGILNQVSGHTISVKGSNLHFHTFNGWRHWGSRAGLRVLSCGSPSAYGSRFSFRGSRYVLFGKGEHKAYEKSDATRMTADSVSKDGSLSVEKINNISPRADAPCAKERIEKSLFVLDDDHVRYDRGRLVAGGDFHQFLPFLAAHFTTVRVCMPALEDSDLPDELGPPRVAVIKTYLYSSYLGYLKVLPFVLKQNVPVFLREVRRADLVLLRVPSPNAVLVFTLACLLKRHTVIAVVGDVQNVSYFNLRYRSRFMRIVRWVGATLDWKLTTMMARHSLVFAYGLQLATKLRKAGVSRVHNALTSLITEEDLNYREDTCRGRIVRLLYVGRLSPEKGLQVLLDSLGELALSACAVHLDIVGEGGFRKILEEEVNLLRGREGLSISLHGYIPAGPDLNRRFDEADIFVLPSLSEGVPKVLLKAMANGLPIVASNVGGIPEIVTPGETGLLVPPGASHALADALLTIIEKPGLRKQLIRNGYALVRDHTAARQARLFAEAMGGIL